LAVTVHIKDGQVIAAVKIVPEAGPDPVLVQKIVNDLLAEIQHHFVATHNTEVPFFQYFMPKRILQINSKPQSVVEIVPVTVLIRGTDLPSPALFESHCITQTELTEFFLELHLLP
jgi:hypothetical protein